MITGDESVKLQTDEVKVTLCRSPEDGVLLLFIDTPGVPEDENGPQLRVHVNDAVATRWER